MLTALGVLVQRFLGGAGNLMSNDSLSNRGWLGVSVQRWLGGAGNMLRNDGTVSQGLDWRVSSKMA